MFKDIVATWPAKIREILYEQETCHKTMTEALVALAEVSPDPTEENLQARQKHLGTIEGQSYRMRMLASQMLAYPYEYREEALWRRQLEWRPSR